MNGTNPAHTTNAPEKSSAVRMLDVAARAEALASDLAAMASTPSEKAIIALIGRQALARAFGDEARS